MIRIIEPSCELLAHTPDPLRLIERCGRVAYRSEDRITEDSHIEFVQRLIRRGHESVLEHASATVLCVTDRGISHELVRHRLASYTQESTRYCNYKDKPMEFICPTGLACHKGSFWQDVVLHSASDYNVLVSRGIPPQLARSVLPPSLATRIVVTANLREWRHILRLRGAKDAHPDMRRLMRLVYDALEPFHPALEDVRP